MKRSKHRDFSWINAMYFNWFYHILAGKKDRDHAKILVENKRIIAFGKM